MKLEIDQGRCEGHGRCYDIAPLVLQPDEDGHAMLVDADGQVPPEDQTQAAAAVRNCPERALRLDP